MQGHGVFFGLVMLLAMSNPQVTLFLPWHKLTFTQQYPNRLAFTMSMLSLLWENAPQISVQALTASRESTDAASTLSVWLALGSSVAEAVYTLYTLLGAAVVLAAFDREVEEPGGVDELRNPLLDDVAEPGRPADIPTVERREAEPEREEALLESSEAGDGAESEVR